MPARCVRAQSARPDDAIDTELEKNDTHTLTTANLVEMSDSDSACLSDWISGC